MSKPTSNSTFQEKSKLSSDKGDNLLRLSTMGRITSIIVHEINNPMQAIQGGAVLGLEEINDPDAVKTYFELIRRESTRVLRMTSLLRETYRSDQAQPEDFNLGDLIEEVLIFIKDDFKQKNILFTSSLPEKMPVVHATKAQIFIVLLNTFLEVNEAIQANEKKELSLVVSENETQAVIQLHFQVPAGNITNRIDEEKLIDVSLIGKSIQSNGGRINFSIKENRMTFSLELPLKDSREILE
jgi:C4-dicarboxylate-specific signal transduction histidine kinase